MNMYLEQNLLVYKLLNTLEKALSNDADLDPCADVGEHQVGLEAVELVLLADVERVGVDLEDAEAAEVCGQLGHDGGAAGAALGDQHAVSDLVRRRDQSRQATNLLQHSLITAAIFRLLYWYICYLGSSVYFG